LATLAELREQKGMTQTEMAGKLGISVSTYNLYENGKHRVPTEIADKIAEIVGTSREKIFLPSTFVVRKTEAV